MRGEPLKLPPFASSARVLREEGFALLPAEAGGADLICDQAAAAFLCDMAYRHKGNSTLSRPGSMNFLAV
jgi:hypothetical protein